MLVLLVIYCIALIFMIYWGFMQSIKDSFAYTNDKKSFWKFNEATIDNYKAIILVANSRWMRGTQGSPGFPEMILNTALYTVGGAFLNALVTCVMAYLAARYNYFFSKIIYMIVVIVMVVPVVGAQASELEILRNLHLYDNRFAFIVLKASFVAGVYFLVFHAAFKDIPITYTEAAMLDGASDWCIMVKICMPLVLNVFMTVFLITFIQYWNDYQLALLYMPSYPTLAYFVFYVQTLGNMKLENGTTVNLSTKTYVLAATFFLIIPVVILFSFLHERLMGNLSVGGIKG